MSSIEFRLRRPNLDTPWGFRLQGGQDVNQPLTIQRVFNGSPADGNLQRGDVILSINNHNVNGGYLKSAEELVRGSANNLTVVVRRTGQIVNSSQPNEDLSPQQSRHRTLDSSAGSPSRYSQQSVASSHQSQPQQQQQQRGGNVWRPSQQQQQQHPTVDVYSNHSGDYPQSLTSPVGSAVSPADAGASVYLPIKTQWSVDSRQQQQQQQQRPTGFGQQWSSGQHEHDQQALPPFSHQQSVQQSGNAQNFAAKPTSSPLSSGTTPQSSHQGQGQGQGPRFQHQPADVDDDYEAKSVRDIKKMFNQLSKPLEFGPKQSAPKPGPWQDSHQLPKKDDVSNSRSWDSEPSKAGSSSLLPKRQPQNSTFSQPSRTSFSPPPSSSSAAAAPSKPNSSALYDYPPPRQELSAVGQLNRSTMSKPVAAQTKPGAGYSYQGIVTVTPAKKVHSKNSSSGQSGQPANKKKEFDPSQSLVYQMLQEENERKKRGEVDVVEEEEARPPRQQQQPQQAGRGGRGGGGAGSGGPQYEQPQQRGSRLQELLERDQAQSQQLEDQSGGSVYGQQQPMSAKSRREMSPSYPGHHPSHDPRAVHQSPSRQRQQQPQQHQPSGPGATNHQQHHYQVQQYEQQYHYQQPMANQQMHASASSSGGYDGYGLYDGGYQNTAASAYDGGYSGGIPISDF